ncbi:uncharacterized protein VDAG_09003 [Verticillium dahliae VdLs.17]|uniref:Uncharacterized protein n=1 Tax=Verticillium dahliae (strain VdLs.17 / ATCC MYA-4575 / FGSC 10137) TaxID=498257 RepID=G2XG24_VERDV|nr:uncharacterized protein VDAG_09003 [Verticillium dahliae VdLs.17]EGY18843.1 hypothetical protein VDAG_09003 [Verticillium dahliae VdLs.17]
MPSRNASGSSFDFNTFLAPLTDQDQDPDQEQDRDRSSYVQHQLHHFEPRHIADPGFRPIPVHGTPSLVATAPAASYPGTPSTEKKQTKKNQSKKESKAAQGLHKAQDKQRQKRQASQPTTPTPRKPPSTPAKKTVTMSSQTGKFRDDQILVICPGSHTTMAQLGCGELTPPAHRIPTRMFKDSDSDEWRPYHTYKRKKARTDNAPASGAEDEYEWVEDTDSDEGAVYPIVAGRIVNMNAFLAFLDHVHGLLTTTYHNTPIVLMVSPQWARPHTEMIARYIFENTRTPALCMIHSGLATTYGVRWTNATVVDIGFEKVDVSCIYEGRVVAHRMLGNFNPERIIAGGEVFTRKLQSLLKDKGFTYDMAEQLKKSPIAEALPYNPEAEARMDLPTASTAGVAANAVVGDGAAAAIPDAPKIDPSKPVVEGGIDDDAAATTTTGDNDGVLDITSIVTSGQTREFLAKKEKEKTAAGPGKGRKGKAQEAETARLTRLPNSKRTHNIFHYEEVIQEEPQQEPKPNGASKETNASVDGNSNGNDKDVDMTDEPKTDSAAAPVSADEAKPSEPTSETAESKTDANGVEVKAEATPAPPAPESVAAVASEIPEADTTVALNAQPVNKRVRRDIEVGLERFLFVNRDEVDRIVGTIYRTIQESVYEMYMRPACWDNIVIVGGGARLRGLRENIYQTLLARHLVSPSTATMFTSELPSNMATPTGTGAQTPTGSFTGAPHQLGPSGTTSSGVNPLLQAATTASSFGLPPGGPSTPGAPGSAVGDPNSTSGGHSYHFHSQTPTSIKLAPMPTYLTQWTKHGFEDAMFLGCLVAGRLAFTVHNLDMASLDAQRMMSLNRIEYNEMGPKGIRTHSMLQ